jgi:hypothetical protein
MRTCTYIQQLQQIQPCIFNVCIITYLSCVGRDRCTSHVWYQVISLGSYLQKINNVEASSIPPSREQPGPNFQFKDKLYRL